MSDAEMYLRELRHALPMGCRRRFVAEVREHFESAVAAEAQQGIGRHAAERLTIERLGPPETLADQFLSDLRTGALGPMRRLTAALSTTRLVVGGAALTATAVVVAVFAGAHSTRAPSNPQHIAKPPAATVTLDPKTGEVRMAMYGVREAVQKHQSSITAYVTPTATTFYLHPASPKK